MMLLQAKEIRKYYGPLEVLKGIDLTVDKAEIVSIVGASGAGKTTLLQILGTLDNPDKGKLNINGVELSEINQTELALFRNKFLGFVFQFHNLLPEFTALENVCIPGYLGKRDRNVVEKRGKELLEKLGVSSRMDHRPSQMSGGEQQRVSVARALINDPCLVLADEPTGNLDSQNAEDLHKLFFNLRDELGQTFIIVTHNEKLADMADRKLVMKDGNII